VRDAPMWILLTVPVLLGSSLDAAELGARKTEEPAGRFPIEPLGIARLRPTRPADADPTRAFAMLLNRDDGRRLALDRVERYERYVELLGRGVGRDAVERTALRLTLLRTGARLAVDRAGVRLLVERDAADFLAGGAAPAVGRPT